MRKITPELDPDSGFGSLPVLFVGLIAAQGDGGCRQVAMEVWENLQAQLDSQQDQLDSQQDQICALYEDSELDFPPECITLRRCPGDCNPCIPTKTTVCP